MSPRIQTSTPGSRESARARLRQLTRVAVLAVTGATVAIGVLVAHEHPGAGSPHKGTTTGSGSTAGNGTTGGSTSSSSGNSGNTGSTGSTGNTGNSGSTAPTSSSSTPSVTSGGTSR